MSGTAGGMGQDRDLLGRETTVQRLVDEVRAFFSQQRVLKDETVLEDSSLVMAVEGPWGIGKSTVIARMFAGLPLEDGGAESGADTLVLRRSSWLCASARLDPWEDLALRLGEALYRRLQRDATVRNVHQRDEFRVRGLRRPRDPDKGVLEGFPAVDWTQAPGVPVRVHEGGDRRLPWRELALRVSESLDLDHWGPEFSLFAAGESRLKGRRFSGDAVADATLSLVPDAVAAYSGTAWNPVSTSRNVISAVRRAVRAERLAREQPEVHSDRYVGLLGRLLRRVGPRAVEGRPALVVVLEDLARVSVEEQERTLGAVAWLAQLPRTLVVIEIDQLPAAAVRAANPTSNESAAVRLVQRRVPVALPRLSALSAAFFVPALTVFLEGLPDEANLKRVLPDVQRQLMLLPALWVEAGVVTPRHFRHAVGWWNRGLRGERWRHLESSLDWESGRAEQESWRLVERGLVASLVALGALFPWVEGRAGFDWLDRALYRGEGVWGPALRGLVGLPANPLTHGPWADRLQDLHGSYPQLALDIAEVSPDGLRYADLVGRLRMLEMMRQMGVPRAILRANAVVLADDAEAWLRDQEQAFLADVATGDASDTEGLDIDACRALLERERPPECQAWERLGCGLGSAVLEQTAYARPATPRTREPSFREAVREALHSADRLLVEFRAAAGWGRGGSSELRLVQDFARWNLENRWRR